ncbi:hypothetical protein NLJ89_g3177 [Agrocybe chaxingu]|uniref:Uncharacterized protein n=1 Tax=Agrocybe chaxingu TaxID=84603 RepID=A0A9W8K2Y2_9AGAR|nr:hypothetical protein NLJ89_g3177 [Agrocybe chaxingu]
MPTIELAPTDLQYLPPSSPIRMFASTRQPVDQAGPGFVGNAPSLQDAMDQMVAVFANVVLFYARLVFWTYTWIYFIDKAVGKLGLEGQKLAFVFALFWTIFCHSYLVPIGSFLAAPANPSGYLRDIQSKTSERFATFVGSFKQKMPTWTAFNPFQRGGITLTQILALRQELSEDKVARADYEQQVTRRMDRLMTYLEANNDLVRRVMWSLEKVAQMLWDGMQEVQEAKECLAEGEAKWEAERALFTQRELGHVETITGLKEVLQLREVELHKEQAKLAKERQLRADQHRDTLARLQRENDAMKESLKHALTIFASFDGGVDVAHSVGVEP